MKYINKHLILTKLEDNKYGGNHINGVNVGSQEVQGYCLDEITPGQQLYLYSSNEDVHIGDFKVPKEELLCAWTSIVESFDEENMLLKTANSLYKIEIKE